MTKAVPTVGIIILNWNGWRDTIECLESLYRQDHPNFFVVIVDNGSTNDSVERITRWASEFPGAQDKGRLSLQELLHEGSDSTPSLSAEEKWNLREGAARRKGGIVLVRSTENLGFAAGCNLGTRLSLSAGCEYIWLLNNDTVVTRNALGKLVSFLEAHPKFAGATGQIRYHDTPNIIWNCGGSLLPLGLRRYDYCGAAVDRSPKHGYKRVSYVTGCAFLLRAQLMQEIGFLTEKFFFGEEDLELCHRLKRKRQLLACRYDAIIYHKVSASVSAVAVNGALAKAHVHYLNRFVHMRTYWTDAFWECWRRGYCIYIAWLLYKSWGISYKRSFPMLQSLLRESKALDRVDKATFTRLMMRSRTR